MPGSDKETVVGFVRNTYWTRAGGYSSMQEPLPSMCEALSSILNSTTRRKETTWLPLQVAALTSAVLGSKVVTCHGVCSLHFPKSKW